MEYCSAFLHHLLHSERAAVGKLLGDTVIARRDDAVRVVTTAAV